ncbi:hypothetical protein UPYG_G00235460 [Umbra pygmaea]|uniref:NHS-like protein 2 n=1 Tax=Umbra pygmaea TaxID=75934 RepID=A0ABD0WE79_UMBPY
MFWDRKNSAMGTTQRQPKGRHRPKGSAANTNLEAESKRSAAATATAAHFRSPWQQSVNVFGSWSRPDCVQELHQEAQLNLQSLLQDFEEQLYDTKVTGQTFRHPTTSSQSSEDTSSALSRSPVSLNNKTPELIFLPASKGHGSDEDEKSSLRIRGAEPSPSSSPCGSDRPLVGWSSNSIGPPVAEKPRWHLGRRTPTHLLPLDVTGEIRLLGLDLLQGSYCPSTRSPSLGSGGEGQPRSLEPLTDTPVQHLPLRKTHSDLDSSLNLPESPRTPPPTQGTMDHSTALLCSNSPSQSWNGPKGSTFSPGAWNEAYSYTLAPGPLGKAPATMPKGVGRLGGQAGSLKCPSQTGMGLSTSSDSQSNSFTSISEPSGHRNAGTIGMMMGRRSETEGAVASPLAERRGSQRGLVGGERRERSARSIAAANAFKFRERSLSTPNDSGSFCSADNISGGVYGVSGVPGEDNGTNGNGGCVASDLRCHDYPRGEGCERGESYALLYPSGSSEDGSTSVDNVSLTDGNFPPEGRLRLRSRSISLKKSKRKPPPPVRSVSLMKNLGDSEGRVRSHDGGHYRDGRPKSLHIPRELDFQPDFLLPSSISKPDLEEPRLGHCMLDGPPSLEVQEPDSTELSYPAHWQLGEWKSSDPYRSLSGSSTATGTTVIECMKVQGSSESLLDSPSTSRATSPSLLSIEAESNNALSLFKPPGLMSPSSGYSSQSETPTPITPSSQVVGTPTGPAFTTGCKMRPKIPERKSSLPASPRDPAARSRLSFEMPVNAHLDLSSIKPKQKAGRRHSDTSTATKPGKLSPSGQSAIPVVTTNELRNIRLRCVSRTDLDDCPDGASNDIIEEEQGRDLSPPPVNPGGLSGPLVAPKPKPPVAMKPPLPKRPLNLHLKSPSSSPVASDSPPVSPVDAPAPCLTPAFTW